MNVEEVIWSMYMNGSDYKEIAKATGYAKSTVSGLITKLKLKYEEEKPLTFAEHPKPKLPIIEVNGKRYQDITELFLSSEWKGCVRAW